MPKIGFTGTQHGMTRDQHTEVMRWLFLHAMPPSEVHHGGCIGADAAVHTLATVRYHIPVVLHPPSVVPTIGGKEAACEGCAEVRERAPYLVRNRHIVDETEILLATPKGPETRRGGTWSTIRYARKLKRPIVIFWPDGSITKEGFSRRY